MFLLIFWHMGKNVLHYEFLITAGVIHGLKSFKRVMSIIHIFEQWEHKLMGNKPYMHLLCIATDPAFQGKGYGSVLLQPELEYADLHDLPCYLVFSMCNHFSHNKRRVQILVMCLSTCDTDFFQQEQHLFWAKPSLL